MNFYRNRYSLWSIPQIPSGPVFSPLDIAWCSTWLDASKLVSTDGTAITSWTDMSWNARHFTGGSATYKTAILNWLPVLRFTTWSSLSNSYDYWIPCTVIYVGKGNDTAVWRYLSGKVNNWLMGAWYAYRNTFYAQWWVSVGLWWPTKDTSWHIWNATQSTSNAYMWDWLTSLGLPNPTAGTQGPNGLAITGHLGTSERSNMDVAELLVYNSELSTTDREKVVNYLKAKYNL